MKNKIIIPIIGLISIFSLLFSWGGYERSMPYLATSTDSKQVTVLTKTYTAEESKKFLKKDLISRGVQPIQVTIHNNTSSVVTVEDIDIPQPTAGEIARRISKESIPRAMGYRAASLLFWPFIIPSAIDSFKTLKTYSKMKREFAAKAVKLETIAPFSTFHRILFVEPENMKESLTLTLYDQYTGKLEEYKVALS